MNILSDNALQIAKKRYFLTEDEGWGGLSIRCGEEVSKVESNPLQYKDKFIEMIHNMEFIPAGRILRNLRRLKGSLFNCYVLPLNDSIEDIGQFIKECLIAWSEGGGIGVNASFLRPEGTIIKGKGGFSSGPISFLKAANTAASCIESGGQRRAAALALMLVSHPDILKFIDAKIIDKEFNSFNISVGITDKFLECVEKNAPWELKFNQQIYSTIDAGSIWDKILVNMVEHAEPGLINWTNLRSNNSYYFEQIQSVNPCAESPLGAHGVCDLGSIVLPKFVSNVNTNWKKMEDTIRLGVRLLDNIIEINKYILPQFEQNAHNGRRIGIGVMGLADYLFAKKIRYGSTKSILEVEKLMRFVRDISYDESIKLATEKGSFTKFDSGDYGKAHFIRTLPASTRMDIKKHGIRNVTLMAMAPSGTISLLPEVTSGIEPLFAKAYKRSDKVSERYYVHPLYKQIIEGNEDIPDWFVDSKDLLPKDHLEMQSVVQKYTDGAVSKTINMPKGTTTEDLSSLLLEYIHDLKGVTVYVDGSREGQILNNISKDELLKYIKDTTTSADESSVKCSSGKCEL